MAAWQAAEAPLSDWRSAAAIGGGIDLGSRDDLASFALCARFETDDFDPDSPTWRYELRQWSYVSDKSDRDCTQAPFAQWVHDGLLIRSAFPIDAMA